jgi:hypothetical protein
MEFLNFGLLPWFLPLVAIPVVLHLLTLYRLKTVDLSTFRFLFDSYVQQRRRMKFIEALIATLRTLFLLFLVFVICRPVVRHWDALFGSGSQREVVLLVDCSASMNATAGGVSAISQAKQAAIEVAERLRPDDRVTLYRLAAKPEEVFSRFSSDAESIRESIENLTVSASRANLFAGLSELFGPESRQLVDPVIYLFTDRQANSWKELDDELADGLIPPGSRLVVVGVGSNQELPNRAVVGDVPQQHRIIAGLPITLRPRVVNHSDSESEEISVRVFIDDKEVARENITLGPGESGQAEIIYTPTQPGQLRGRFEIPPDRFTDDDTFLFSLAVEPQLKVLLVNGKPAADPFDDEALYLSTALTTTGAEHGNSDSLQPEKEFVRSLDVHEVPQPGLNAEALRDSSVVILANCGALNAPQFAMLRDFVAQGGGLLIFPGDQVKPDVYKQQFFAVPGVPDERLIWVDLSAAQGDPKDAASFERFAALDFSHPVLSVFEDRDSGYLTRVVFYRRFPLHLPEQRGPTASLADFSNGEAAIIESRFGDGRVLMTAFPANTRWSNLPLKPEFVPLVLRMVSYVKHRPELDGPAVVPADGRAVFVVAQSWNPVSGTIKDVRGVSTPVEFQRSESRLKGSFARTSEKGFYSLVVQGGRAEQKRQQTIQFAVNLSPEESNFETLTEAEVKRLLPGVDVTVIDASAQAQQAFGSIGDQREIWRPLIFLLFVIIGIEFLLSTPGGTTKRTDEPVTWKGRLRSLSPGAWAGSMTGAGEEETLQEAETEVSILNQERN